jgi:hypothetical protein
VTLVLAGTAIHAFEGIETMSAVIVGRGIGGISALT